jgi:hypothetical protein
MGPQQFDCIETCDDVDVKSADELHKNKSISVTLTYLHRPFGRPNTIINDDRGWLFLERVTIAIKAAAAEKAQFDDIVVSNSESLRLQIYKWSERLRDAASKQKKEPQALRNVLDHFDGVLQTKQFSFSSDEKVVRKLMTKLINQFAEDWNGEVEKQTSMTKRAREILLRWGKFSEQYVERAGFLSDKPCTVSEVFNIMIRLLMIMFIGPFLGVLPFTFEIVDGVPNVNDDLLHVVVFVMLVGGLPSTLMTAIYERAFAEIPLSSLHHLLLYLQIVCFGFPVWFGTRFVFDLIALPLDSLCNTFVYILLVLPVLSTKCFQVTDSTNGKTVYISMTICTSRPCDRLTDPKTQASLARIKPFTGITALFCMLYRTFISSLFQYSTSSSYFTIAHIQQY